MAATVVRTGGRERTDYVLLLAVLGLLALGTIAVFSASAEDALAAHHPAYYFAVRQLAWAGLGLVAMVSASRVDYWRYQRWGFLVFAVSVVLLALVLVPGIGREINGSRRWIGSGSLVLQPSELAKLGMVLLFARLFSLHQDRIGDFWRGVVPHLALAGVVFALVLAEPDLGTTIALAATFFVMLFMAGLRWRHLAGLVVTGTPVLAWAMLGETYRRNRLLAFLDPWKHPLTYGFHTIQALLALGSGGLLGVGLGFSRQAFGFLPEDYTDFIFAILGEELGLVGTLTVVILFAVVTWRGYRIAMRAPDSYSALLAAGVTTVIAVQAAINMGVVTATLPVTGITLPFISYGGSSLVLSLTGVGILLNISRHST
ncbi:factor for spore cortex peptidoglycan synthesis (stage V sporulation) [Candidatus Hydrogenisulfobacillus filiaventi]|uniref:Probable peptidoglycan glycosyltransferase FtsW n=1 Tax=Candidatus Hydrogenisulfobacillus filiaventi TaxID=2707344 RepID=A0A6F8ZFE6_9FIRM|nr:putative lipid II flippase FtsW [Bacillota bacterium]CAB1128465.1 factor for spore cortex peptidoglycan synthesis (stage V sporulation) [Candidatus Hydrogenisulfobacillus filiaventi]